MINKIIFIVGTRPEFIKLSSTIIYLKKQRGKNVIVVFTNQHPDLGIQAATSLGVDIDEYIEPLSSDRSTTDLLGHLIQKLPCLIRGENACVVAQGDTISVLGAALVARLCKIPFIHVEAGIRSGTPIEPFPEEITRRLISQIADLHICFSQISKNNLIKESYSPSTIKISQHPLEEHVKNINKNDFNSGDRHDLLITIHRQERRKERIESIVTIIKQVHVYFPKLNCIFVWHPGVPKPNNDWIIELESYGCKIIDAIEPLGFLHLLISSKVVLTDSAGVAEECQLLDIPLAIYRSVSEHRHDISSNQIYSEIICEDPNDLATFILLYLKENKNVIIKNRSICNINRNSIGMEILNFVS